MTVALVLHFLKANAFLALSSFMLAVYLHEGLTPKSGAKLYAVVASLLLGLIFGLHTLFKGSVQTDKVLLLALILLATTLTQAGLGAIHGYLQQAPAKA